MPELPELEVFKRYVDTTCLHQNIEMIEVKQGPYAGDQDKTRFTGVTADRIVVKE